MAIDQQLRRQFSPFAEQLTDLHTRIMESEDPATLDGHRDVYLDPQARVDYFQLDPEHIGMLFTPDPDIAEEGTIPLPEHVRNRVETMKLGLGHLTLEQIVAYSDTHPLAIVTQTYSTPLMFVDAIALRSIPARMYRGLFNTFGLMQKLGLTIVDEHGASVTFPELDAENLSVEKDFIVTKYYRAPKNAKSQFLQHVLQFGKELVWGAPDGQVPDYAIHYYLACEKYLGAGVSMRLIDAWMRRGVVIPQVDYSAEWITREG